MRRMQLTRSLAKVRGATQADCRLVMLQQGKQAGSSSRGKAAGGAAGATPIKSKQKTLSGGARIGGALHLISDV